MQQQLGRRRLERLAGALASLLGLIFNGMEGKKALAEADAWLERLHLQGLGDRFPRRLKPLGPTAALEIGTFSLKTKDANPKEVTGKYVVVWEKVGSAWKLATDIWNEGK